MSALRELRARLGELHGANDRTIDYLVPALWMDPDSASDRLVKVDPIDWWFGSIDRIDGEDRRSTLSQGRGWTRYAVVYNLFVRATAAFDHDGDGRISLVNRNGYRETGTFLKSIALLPYIRSLGCNTIHLLPINAIGEDGRKGRLGSPYAVRDPYRLDETLAEPAVGLGAEIEFAAYVEAAHRLGLRVVVEFALRTAAKDSDWVAEHPEWFYWIRDGDAPFGSPTFPSDELRAIKERVNAGQRANLPPPPCAYRSLFVRPTEIADVARDGTAWIGCASDGQPARIPGAFADWPPDDTQPAWSDVTYLRMYDHPEFDYMAYNTLRMYDERLARPENAVDSLWERIAGVIPHYQRRFGIDGALIDMGHALPEELKAILIDRAHRIDEDFAFWDEAFEPSERARSDGYSAVMGNLWWVLQRPERIREHVERLESRGVVIPSLATPETHNTPRSAAREGGRLRSKLAWVLGAFLPSLPFVHSGFELGEIRPINTGLDFSAEEIARHPMDRLGLYNAVAYDWAAAREIAETIRRSLALRSRYAALVTDPSAETIWTPDLPDERLVGYARMGKLEAIVVIGLYGGPTRVVASLTVPLEDGAYVDALTGRRYRVEDGQTAIELEPWDVMLIRGRRRLLAA